MNGNTKNEVACAFFVIFSNKTTNELKNDICEHLGCSVERLDNSLMMRVHFKDKKQTNTTFFLTNNSIGNKLIQDGQELQTKCNFTLRKFELEVVSEPIRELFIPFPKGKTDPIECNLKIKSKLSQLISLLDLPQNMVNVIMRRSSRINEGEYKKFCLINFDNSVNQELIHVIKIMLHDSLWGDNLKEMRVRCMWSKNKRVTS